MFIANKEAGCRLIISRRSSIVFNKIMSICYQNNYYAIIDHCKYSLNLYHKVCVDNDNKSYHSYKLLPKLFSIKRKKEMKNRKRKKDSIDVYTEADIVKQLYNKLTQDKSILDIFNMYNLMETLEVRDLAGKLYESTNFDLNEINGGNNSDIALKCRIKDNYFLVPPNCRFYCGCVKEQCMKLEGNVYDIVIADPPWWNKYIGRLKGADQKLSYSMMYNEDIAAIPVKKLLSDNALIAIWCTNAPSNIMAVKEQIFPEWGVDYVTTWYWLKVTVDMEPLCEFGGSGKKQPYERLIIGKTGVVKNLPENLLFASVPSALHSHKPPLIDLLRPYLNCDDPQILELFARYLLPNTTSVGFEPLKWQHLSLYV